jgi:2-methylisocitrate lyase-like PEP mutase family enzyme
MNKEQQLKSIKKFRKLHNNNLFFLPNAWNGGSARVFEKQGFSAIGTTSAGIAYSLGYEDGEKIHFDDVLRVTKEIIAVTQLPITVDIERGYGHSLKEIISNVEEIIMLGAAGINIEDGQSESNSVDSLSDFEEKIRAIAKLRVQLGIPFVINARTDLYLLNTASTDEMFKRTVDRAQMLERAGADCIFIPGALDEETIIRLRSNINLPINLFVHSAFHNTKRLSQIGINRLSSGSAPIRTTLETLINLSTSFSNGDCEPMLSHDFTYTTANSYFKER